MSRSTGELADEAHGLALQVLGSVKETERTVSPVVKLLEDTDNLMQLIGRKLRRRDWHNLSVPVHKIVGCLQQLKGATEDSLLRPQHHQGIAWHQILNDLSRGNEELNQSIDVQCARLQESTSEVRWTNTDFNAFFNRDFEGWSVAAKDVANVYLSMDRVHLYITFQSVNSRDKLFIQCHMRDSFHSACDAFVGFLSGISAPLEWVFPTVSRSMKPGEIRFDNYQPQARLHIAWVYHNIFVQMRLVEGDSRPTTGPQSVTEKFYNLAEQLFQYIRAGSVRTRQEATFPVVGKMKGPKCVKNGERFVVIIEVDRRYQHKVDSRYNDGEEGSILFLYSKTTMTGRKYFFDARQAGVCTIHFCFAHNHTYNYVSMPYQVVVEPCTASKLGSGGDSADSDKT